MPMATKRGRMMTYLAWILPINSHDHIITWSCKITWQTKIIIYPLTQCPWLSILAAWGDTEWGIPSHKVTRPFDHVVYQGYVKYISWCIISNVRPMATKLGKVVTYSLRNFNTLSYTTLSTCGHVRSHKLKTLYPHHHNVYDHQTWLGGYIQWESSFWKVTWPFDHVV